MAKLAKFLQGVAGAGGAALNVEDVFSTYLYTGDGGTMTITNDIDLSTEGGLVWEKNRSGSAYWHHFRDSETDASKMMELPNTSGLQNVGAGSFTTTGYTANATYGATISGRDYVSWTFRKAPKFFDVVTYTGDGTGTRQLSHNLDSTIGTIIVKRTDGIGDWWVYHRSARSTNTDGYLRLNLTNAEAGSNQIFPVSTYNSTQFTVGNSINVSSETYVAYLFAHNNGDGDFGSTADQDIIKCGSYTGGVSVREVNLGFEPQWVLIKNITTSGSNWHIVDNMRGTAETSNKFLYPNLSSAEASDGAAVTFKPTGFNANGGVTWHINDSSSSSATYIYIAIRRGPMVVPESATDVFAIDTRAAASGGTPAFTSGFVTDFGFTRRKSSAGSWEASSRLTQGQRNWLNLTNAESAEAEMQFDYMDGFNAATGANSDILGWMWKRAPNYFDVVAYTGTGTNYSHPHNLQAVPEMMWVKNRTSAYDWQVYHKDLGNSQRLVLNSNASVVTSTILWNSTTPTSTTFRVANNLNVNSSGNNYIAYLFASLDGVSKVGSYTGNGSTQNIDCGFSSGARFVLIKCSSGSGNWVTLDTQRGIVSGNDPYLFLNDTAAEDSFGARDVVDPYSSGFTVNSALGGMNNSGDTFIFYAIA